MCFLYCCCQVPLFQLRFNFTIVNTSINNDSVVAIMGGYSNYLDVQRELGRLGLHARHVIRPAYRESLRWLRYQIATDNVEALLPLMFVHDSGNTVLASNEEELRRELGQMGLAV